MIVHAPEADVKPVKPGDCGCGGRCGCESRCCDLECLVRPRFFCGQVLTDTDLSAAIDWTRNRLSLARYRHGWGVVCGLDVTCTDPRGGSGCCPDPRDGPRVYVGAGYAMDCCGNDLVVCEPFPVDLSDMCRPEDDPCAQPWKRKTKPEEAKPSVAGTRASSNTAPGAARGKPEDCWTVMGRGLFAVQLSLRYNEDLAHGQRAMFRSGCGDTAACEYSRVLERPCVYAERVELRTRDDDDEAEAWKKDFEEKSKRVRVELERVFGLGADAVLKYLRRNPPARSCFLDEVVCCLRDADEQQTPSGRGSAKSTALKTPDWLYVKRMIYLDWYMRQLDCACWSCKPDKGVPIARVLLQALEGEGGARCRVVAVDPTPPHRRHLRKDPCRPVPDDSVDLGRYVGGRAARAESALKAAGLKLELTPAGDDLEVLGKIENGPMWRERDDKRALRAYVITDPYDESHRVLGFSEV
jgi:hypothetical protein